MSIEAKEAQVEKRNEQTPAQPTSEDIPVYVPAVDVYEKDGTVLLRCDMPGVSDQQLDIVVENKVLTIEGVQDIDIPEGYSCLSREYGRGRFQRSFRLADNIDVENITARIKNGVLDVELPRSEEAKPRKITVHPS